MFLGATSFLPRPWEAPDSSVDDGARGIGMAGLCAIARCIAVARIVSARCRCDLFSCRARLEIVSAARVIGKRHVVPRRLIQRSECGIAIRARRVSGRLEQYWDAFRRGGDRIIFRPLLDQLRGDSEMGVEFVCIVELERGRGRTSRLARPLGGARRGCACSVPVLVSSAHLGRGRDGERIGLDLARSQGASLLARRFARTSRRRAAEPRALPALGGTGLTRLKSIRLNELRSHRTSLSVDRVRGLR